MLDSDGHDPADDHMEGRRITRRTQTTMISMYVGNDDNFDGGTEPNEEANLVNGDVSDQDDSDQDGSRG